MSAINQNFNSKLRNVIAETTWDIASVGFVYFIYLLLCYVLAEIGLYCKSRYFDPFLTTRTAETELA